MIPRYKYVLRNVLFPRKKKYGMGCKKCIVLFKTKSKNYYQKSVIVFLSFHKITWKWQLDRNGVLPKVKLYCWNEGTEFRRLHWKKMDQYYGEKPQFFGYHERQKFHLLLCVAVMISGGLVKSQESHHEE